MAKTRREFTYTANREQFIGLALGFILAVLFEAMVIDLVLALAIKEPLIKWPIFSLMVGIHLYIIFLILSPLRKKHYLTNDKFLLNFGFYFKWEIPVENLAAAETVNERVDLVEAMLTTPYDSKKRRLKLAFSNQGLVLLTLTKPQTFKVKKNRVMVDEILLNFDKPAEFLQAISSTRVSPNFSGSDNAKSLPHS